MVIQDDRFMSKLADEQIFFFDFLFERQSSFKISGCSLERCLVLSGSHFCFSELLLEVFNLCLRVFD